MSNLIRWEPVREMMTLREAMNQLFNDSYTRPISMGAGSVLPAIDLYQDDEQVVVRASLPGLKAEDVQISITADVLTLRGEFKAQNGNKEATYHIREHSYGVFERAMQLPTAVQTDKSKAEFENGILTITLPKAEAVKPRTISIKVK
jgi:HSP20 family protein